MKQLPVSVVVLAVHVVRSLDEGRQCPQLHGTVKERMPKELIRRGS